MDTIAEVVTVFLREGATALRLHQDPVPIPNLELKECYRALRVAANTYQEAPNSIAQQEVADAARTALDMVEFQACWKVLRQIHPDPVLQSMNPQERQRLYRDCLYQAPLLFPFFPARERMLTDFAAVGIIPKVEEYRALGTN